MHFQYHIPTKIIFKDNALDELVAVELPGKRALIVTGGTSVKKYGYLAKVKHALAVKGIDYWVFDKVQPNPVKAHVEEGAAMAITYHCDFVLGLGGGSAMDTAKAIAVLANNGGDYWDYISGGTGKGLPANKGALPIVTVSTTAATGSEVDPWAVITKESTKEKAGFGNEHTYPTLSIIDPLLTLSVPHDLTAYQGFDILLHAAEGYIANTATPISDMYALKSVQLVAMNLPAAVDNGDYLIARRNLCLANILSGFVESTSSCTSEHAIEHALSAYHPELPHGAGLAFLAEDYFKFFLTICPDRLANLAFACGMERRPEDFITFLKLLKKQCRINLSSFSKYGLNRSMIINYAKNAMDVMGGLYQKDRKQLDLVETVMILTASFDTAGL
jgi:alcohol dehydrogenase